MTCGRCEGETAPHPHPCGDCISAVNHSPIAAVPATTPVCDADCGKVQGVTGHGRMPVFCSRECADLKRPRNPKGTL